MRRRIADLSPEEQENVRAYNREKKRESRQKQRLATYIRTAEEWSDEFASSFPEQVNELNAYVKELSDRIVEELGRKLGNPQKDSTGNVVGWNYDEEYTVDRVGRTLLGLKKGWVRRVWCPEGELVAGSYFADADCSFASDVIESAYRHGLKQSPTFVASFRELLELLNKSYGRQQNQDSAAVRAELAGTYVRAANGGNGETQ